MPEATRSNFKRRDVVILLSIILVVSAVGAIGIATLTKMLMVKVPTSQGEIVRNSVNVSFDEDGVGVAYGFRKPRWFQDANKVELANDLCAYVMTSDWTPMGVTLADADSVVLSVDGMFGIQWACDQEPPYRSRTPDGGASDTSA